MLKQFMIKYCAVFFLLSLLAISAARAEVNADAGVLMPKLAAPESVFDFGVVQQGTPVEHRFQIRNSGAGPLKIERMHTSCGCTAAVLDTDTIEPGSETQVKVTFDTTGFQGEKVKTVRLYTNDPKQASVLFTLQGTVRPDVELSIPRLNYGDLRKGQAQLMRVEVTATKSSGIQITDVSSRSPFLEVAADNLKENDKTGKSIAVKLKSSLPVGVFRDRIVVKTTSSINPVVNIPVFARVLGDLRITPSTVSFGLVDGPLRAPLSQTVKVENISGAKVRVTEVDSDNPSVSAQLIPLNDGKSFTIKVTVREDLTGAFRAKIKLTTDNTDTEQTQLNLPVYGIISRGGEN